MSKSNSCSEQEGYMTNLKLLDDKVQDIIRQATEVRGNAYCPYSNFQVGAAVLCQDGTIFSGCNIENSTFTVGICAERCAYGKAISNGKLKFTAISVVAYQENSFTAPCGACRQFLSEFGNVDVYLSKPGQDEVLVVTLAALLPFQFQTVDHKFV
ncbi:hypothetical protein ABEB36_014717 [Hypothenemus hampei]|uniref:Cytidine deaminase n=1 Tax=Hypothenemus hampei TaxID=57062 RepID=A0ABD1E2M6_HYPHA